MYMAIGAGCIIGSGYLSLKSKHSAQKLLAIRQSVLTPISESINQEGSKTISGIARMHEDTIDSQLKNEECLVYSSIIKDTSGIIKNNLFETKEMIPFIVQDGDDTILIGDTNLSVILSKDFVPVDNPTTSSVVSQEIPANTSIDSITTKEGNINQDTGVFVHGKFKVRNDPDHTAVVHSSTDGEAIVSNLSKSNLTGHLTKRLIATSVGATVLFLLGFLIVWLGIELF